jgi:hypothetical protein
MRENANLITLVAVLLILFILLLALSGTVSFD